MDWRLAHYEDLVASGTCRLVLGAAVNVGRRPSVEEGARRHDVWDALTKPLDERRMTNLLTAMGHEFRDGRTSLALERNDDRNCFQQHKCQQWYSGARVSRTARSGRVLGLWHADLRQDVDEQVWNPTASDLAVKFESVEFWSFLQFELSLSSLFESGLEVGGVILFPDQKSTLSVPVRVA